MISCRFGTTVAALLLTAVAPVTGCGSDHAAKSASPSPSRSPAAKQSRHPAAATTALNSRYVDARESEGVRVVRPRGRVGVHESRLINLLTPDSFRVDKPTTATVGEIDVGAGLPPVGVTVRVANAAWQCGAPFLATPGHGYRVRCTITARTPGTVKITLTEHNAKTGAAGSRYTAHARAR